MPGEESIMGPMMAGAGISAAGGIASSALGMWSANRQMKFQERMSSTAYQRAVQDMRKAGLNPMLMYSKASPASTPSGASFTPENPLKEAGPAVAKGMELKMTNARVANETAATSAQVREADARTQLIHEQANNARIEAQLRQRDLELKGYELERQPDIGSQLRLAIENARRDLDVKTANIAHSGAATAELEQRARREKEIADALNAIVPLLAKGGGRIKGIVDWLENPDAKLSTELKPFLDAMARPYREKIESLRRTLKSGASVVWDSVKGALNYAANPNPGGD